MASKMKQVVFPIQIAESTNQNRTKTAAGISARVMKPGATQTGAGVSGTSPLAMLGATFTVDTIGAITVGDSLEVWDTASDAVRGYSLTVGTIDYSAVGDNYAITFSAVAGASTYTIADGDRFIFPLDDANELSLYSDASADNSIANPVVLGTDGMLKFYAQAEAFDLYLSGDGITDNWYAFDVPISRNLSQRIDLSYDAQTTASAVAVSNTASLLVLSGSGTVSTIEDADDNRFLVLFPSSSGIVLSLTSTPTADNQIYGPSTTTITLTQRRPAILTSITTGGYNVWVVSAGAGTLAFNDLSDVDESSPQANDLVQWNGSNYVGAKSFGTASAPLTGGYIDAFSLRLMNTARTFYQTFNSDSLTATRTAIWPDVSGVVLLSSGDATIAGAKNFVAGTSGFKLRDSSVASKTATFDLSALPSSTNCVISVPNKTSLTLTDADDIIPWTDTSPGSGDDLNPVVWDNTNGDYRVSSTIGSDSGGVVLKGTVDIQSGALASAYALMRFGGLASQDVTVPTTPSGSSLTLLGNRRQAVLTIEGPSATPASNGIILHDDALVFADPADTSKRVRVDAGSVSGGATRVLQMADHDIDLSKIDRAHSVVLQMALASGVTSGLPIMTGVANGILVLRPMVDIEIKRVIIDVIVGGSAGSPAGSFQLYHHSSLPTSSTTPPTGTAVLSSAASVASLTGTARNVIANVTSFANPVVSAGDYLFFGEASAVTPPTVESLLTLLVEYEVVQ